MAGRRMADYVELLPVMPFYRLVWDDGDELRLRGRRGAQMEEQIRRRNPGDVAGLPRFVEYTRKVFEKGYEELGAAPFLRFADMVRVAPELVRLRADRSVYDGRPLRRGRAPAAGAVLPLAARGRQPVRDQRHLHPDPLPRAQWGVFFPRGGTGALVRGAGAPVRGAGRRAAALARPGAAHRAAPNGNGRRAPPGHDRRGQRRLRPRGQQRRRAPHLRPALRPGPAGRGDGAAPRAHGLVDVAVRPLLRHRPALPGDWPTTRSSSARATKGCCATSSTARAARRLQPVPARADRDRSLAGAAGLRSLLRALAGAAPGPRAARLGEGRARPTPTASSRARAPAARTCGGTWSRGASSPPPSSRAS